MTDEFISGQLEKMKHCQQVLRQNMCELGSTLRMIIEPDNGFLDSLLDKKVITKEQS
jgi:hypothetical protein